MDEETRANPSIGNNPYAHSNESQLVPMSANEYFDWLSPFMPRGPLPGREADYRWSSTRDDGKENIQRIIEGIKEGMPIGAPEIGFHGDEFTGLQEGGHRMEALRQMGHADTRIPVAVHQREWRHRVKDMPEGRPLPE